MGEILGLGVTHYPPLIGHDKNMAHILQTVLRDPGLPEPLRDSANWPAPLRKEFGNDGGTAPPTTPAKKPPSSSASCQPCRH